MVPELQTERLRLRAWREEDLGPYTRFCSDEAAMRFVGGTSDRAGTWRRMAMFTGHWVLRGYGPWALEEKAHKAFVGYTGLWKPEGWPEPEVMWGVPPEHQGRGYATEAARRVREFAYRELGWSTVISFIDPANAPSQRVAGRLGAERETDFDLRGHTVGIYRHPSRETLNRNLHS
jgi:RimJ/RimL family protein N-acetyltransferase